MPRWRDRPVTCYCFHKCTLGTGPPKDCTARTRQSHMEADERVVRDLLALGQQPAPALLKAADLNRLALVAEDIASPSPSPSTSPSSPSSSSPSLPSLDEGMSGVWFDDDTDGGADSDHEEELLDGEEDEEREFDAESDVNEERLLPGDFDLFFNEGDKERDADRHGAQDQAADQGYADEDDYDINDGGTHSRHAQDLFDQLAGDYSPGPRPEHPPDPETSPLTYVDRLTPSEKATVRHLRTWIRTDGTLAQYKAFGRAIESVNEQEGIKIMGKDRASSLVRNLTGLEEQ
ncbi:unnamed protein product, partial [Tilletia caries]